MKSWQYTMKFVKAAIRRLQSREGVWHTQQLLYPGVEETP